MRKSQQNTRQEPSLTCIQKTSKTRKWHNLESQTNPCHHEDKAPENRPRAFLNLHIENEYDQEMTHSQITDKPMSQFGRGTRTQANTGIYKTCVKRPLSKRPQLVQTNYRLMQIKSNGSILQTFRPSLSYHLSLFCLFLSGCFTQVLLYIKA